MSQYTITSPAAPALSIAALVVTTLSLARAATPPHVGSTPAIYSILHTAAALPYILPYS